MAFNKEAELNEPHRHIELVFSSGRALDKNDLSMPPSAYIAMGWYTHDEDNRVRLTTEEMSLDALEAQVNHIKGSLDACIGDARARFAASKQIG